SRTGASIEAQISTPSDGSRSLRLTLPWVLDKEDHIWDPVRKQVVVAYGATRNLTSRSESSADELSSDVRRQITLFDPLSRLAGADVLLAQQPQDQTLVHLFGTLISQVFGEELEVTHKTPLSLDMFFSLRNGDKVGPLDLPDGFRSAAAWMAD